MARMALNKSSLQRRLRELRTYERYLPSLDLKRRQLLAERNRERAELAATVKAVEEQRSAVENRLPMLGDERIDLSWLGRVAGVELGETNFLGTRLPVLLSTRVALQQPASLGSPFWVDVLSQHLKTTLELMVREQVQKARLQRLESAVLRVTQRVNLFEKVLIPRTRVDIKRIRVNLSDADRAAVVRAKIAKEKILQGVSG
jgi:V/A-type H+-transporting ATPase subunit D